MGSPVPDANGQTATPSVPSAPLPACCLLPAASCRLTYDSGMTTEFMQRLSLAHPIVQGPFGGGFSTARLTATVSNLGGLGSFGAHRLPPDRILQTAADIRAQTGRPFALNLWASNHDPGGAMPNRDDVLRVLERLRPYFDELGLELPEPPARTVLNFQEQAAAVIEARPAVFSLVFSPPPPDIVRECNARDIMVVGAATTPDEARALAAVGVDAIVASGFEAGGHRPSFLAPAEDSLHGTMALVPQLASVVDVPIIAAGGIADARGVAAALQLGAQAAQIGTAFLACD